MFTHARQARTVHLSVTSGSCAGHGFPMRHYADPMDVGGQGCVLLVWGDEKIRTAEKTEMKRCKPPGRPKSLHNLFSLSKWDVTHRAPAIGRRLRAGSFRVQQTEVAIACATLNRMLACALPKSVLRKKATA